MTRLESYQLAIEDGLKQIAIPSEPKGLYDPIRYILGLGGKRMRPALSCFACDLFGGQLKDVLHPALGIELFHNFSLMHDDIMDKAPLRRNEPTVHQKWNTNVAILSGDAMLVKAYQQIARTPSPHLAQVLNIFSTTALQVCEGQQLDMDYEAGQEVSISQYLRMIELKTAVLLGCSLKIGALIGGADIKDAEDLYQFGKYIGIAFQLQDDILDVYGDSAKFGKVTGGDIVSNKKTFLLLTAIQVSARFPYRKEELMQWLHAPHFEPEEKIKAVREVYDFLNIRALATAEMEKYFLKAMLFLDRIPVSPERKNELRSLAEHLMVREV